MRGVRLHTAADGTIDVRGTLDGLLEATPGPEVLTVATRLTDAAELTDADRVDLALVFERCDAWLQSVKQPVFAALGRAAGRKSTNPGRYEDVGLEMSLALRWSEWMCHDRMHMAQILDERLPKTMTTLAAGEISFLQAKVIADGADLLDHPEADDPVGAAAELERRVLIKAPRQARVETEKSVARAVIGIDPAAVEERRKQTQAERCVVRTGGPRGLGERLDGRSGLFGQGAAEDVATIWQGLSVGADKLVATGQSDTLSQGRFDTLLAWATEFLRDQPVPERGARPTSVTLITKGTTVAGEDDDTAELVGHGPITAAAARDLVFGVPPRPGPFSAPQSAVDAETRDSYLWTRRQELEDLGEYDERDDEPLPPDDEPPPGADPPDDDPPGEDPPVEDPPGDGGSGGGGGGGGPPRADGPGPSPETSTPTSAGKLPRSDPSAGMLPRSDPSAVRIRTLSIDPESGFALPRDGLRLDYGTSRRVFPAEVVDHLKDKYRVCAFPGCSAPAHRLDGDHWEPAKDGGTTDASTNAGPGCDHHNRTTRNRLGWTITPNGDGTATLITPQGRSYPITPYDYREL